MWIPSIRRKTANPSWQSRWFSDGFSFFMICLIQSGALTEQEEDNKAFQVAEQAPSIAALHEKLLPKWLRPPLPFPIENRSSSTGGTVPSHTLHRSAFEEIHPQFHVRPRKQSPGFLASAPGQVQSFLFAQAMLPYRFHRPQSKVR